MIIALILWAFLGVLAIPAPIVGGRVERKFYEGGEKRDEQIRRSNENG